MDFEILQGFLDQAESYLPTIRGGILVCAREGNAFGELNTSLRQVKAIKESSAIVELSETFRIAQILESNLAVHTSLNSKLTDEQSRRLLDHLNELEVSIAKVRFSTEDFSGSVAEFVEESFENLFAGFPEAAAPETLEIFPETALDDESEKFPATEIVSEESEDSWGEDFEIDDEMLEIFALEAEDLLKSISANLEFLEKDRNNCEALLEIRRSAHTLKGSAGIIGLKELSAVAHRVEDLLAYLAENEIEADETVFQLLLTATDCLSSLSNNEKSAQLTKKIARIYEDFDSIMTSLAEAKENPERIETKQTDENTIAESFELKSDFQPAEISAETQIKIEPAKTEEKIAQICGDTAPRTPQSVVRVSLEKLDDLVKIANDLIVSRSVFEQRLAELEAQIGELHNSTRRLQNSTGNLETEFEASLLNADSRVRFADFGGGDKHRTGGDNKESARSSNSSFNKSQSFDSLEFDQYTEFHQAARELAEASGDASTIGAGLDNIRESLEALFENQRGLIDEMHDKLLRLRLVSFGTLAVRLQRTVRVTCEEENKSAELFIDGGNTEIDTQILDSLIEPLLHLLRNAVAHGIELPEMRRLLGKPETGKISMRVHNEGTHIVLTVSDDGRGISAAALKEKALANNFISAREAAEMSDEQAFALVFLPGLTTADKISQISGRGVGMNIVKNAIQRGQGTISISSIPQKGTTFTIRLPMALAVTRALLVKAGGQTFAFPLKLIKKITTEIESLSEVKSVISLTELLELAPETTKPNASPLILLETAGEPRVLSVDEILKSQEIVIKPLGGVLGDLKHLLGMSFLGDGRIVPVLDLIYLIANLENNETKKLSDEDSQPTQESEPRTLKILIVDDSPSVRHLTSKVIKNAGWTAITAKDGLDALEILQSSNDLPDVILTDVEMPRMDGYVLLSSLKRFENLREIPVVMITSRAGEKHRRKAFEMGVSEYLTKPFEEAVLINKTADLAKTFAGRV